MRNATSIIHHNPVDHRNPNTDHHNPNADMSSTRQEHIKAVKRNDEVHIREQPREGMTSKRGLAVEENEWVQLPETGKSPATTRAASSSKQTTSNAESPIATFVEIVIDRSGSMSAMGSGTVEQIFNLLVEQKKTAEETKVPTFVSLTTFDNEAEIRLENVDILKARLPTYKELKHWLKPRGLTRLIDTAFERLGHLKSNVKSHLKGLEEMQDEKPSGKIVQNFMLLTDGEDNMSVKNAETLKSELEKARKEEDFTAFFLGANQDAIATGKGYGFEEHTSMTFAPCRDSCSLAIQATSRVMKMRTAAPSLAPRFTDMDRFNSIH
eukprot:jgi/Bigna1/86109/estExt_fgenesh1_pg.C_80100